MTEVRIGFESILCEAIRPGVRECDLVGIGIKALYEASMAGV
mgnify:CR=1 FL=1